MKRAALVALAALAGTAVGLAGCRSGPGARGEVPATAPVPAPPPRPTPAAAPRPNEPVVVLHDGSPVCRVVGPLDPSSLPVALSDGACSTPERCIRALEDAKCPLRARPDFVPPVIHCSGMRLREQPGPDDFTPLGGKLSAHRARALPPCLPTCTEAWRNALSKAKQAEAEWRDQHLQRLEECNNVP